MKCSKHSCQEVEELIFRFACGEASASELAKMKEHLDECGDCQRERDVLAKILSELKGCREDCCIPQGFRERVLVKVKSVARSTLLYSSE